MKRIDSLIIRELLGPWFFGAGIFTVLIMAGTYLFKITDYFVQGISPSIILELTALLLPGIMAKTFSMAMLLSALLAFGRLSGDSEIVALKASGASLLRVMRPVAVFGLLVAGLAFGFNEILVPGAAKRATALRGQIEKTVQTTGARPVFYPVYESGRLTAMVSARDFDLAAKTLSGAHIVTYGSDGEPSLILFAERLSYQSANDWRISGGGRLLSADGSTFIRLQGDVWPSQVPKVQFSPDDLLAGFVKDLDTFSMRQTGEQLARARRNPSFDRGQLANLEFGYWNKLALPLAAVIFALVGAPLGIRNHRAGVASGFWLSVIIIFAYMLVANLMSIYAMGGKLPPLVASFSPLVLGALAAGYAIHRKNT